MGDLTKNISRHEVKCKCGRCDYRTIDFELANIIQGACDHFAAKFKTDRVVLGITSAHRCPIHNAKVGGAPDSMHLKGNAVDHYILGVAIEELHKYYQDTLPANKFGLKLYLDKGFVHLDTGARLWRP